MTPTTMQPSRAHHREGTFPYKHHDDPWSQREAKIMCQGYLQEEINCQLMAVIASVHVKQCLHQCLSLAMHADPADELLNYRHHSRPEM